MKIAFIINSLLSSKEKLERIFNPYVQDSINFQYFETEYAGHSIELAKRCKEDKFDWIISVGGDGTLNEIINGLIDEDNNQEVLPYLAMFPEGTGNDFSQSIKTTKDPAKLIKAITKNAVRRIDIGKIHSPTEGTSYFINVADAGMGGEITRKISTSGNVMGKWIYYKTILQSFFTFKRPTLQITTPEKQVTSKILTVVIGKGVSFGGGYKIVYDAKLNDGTFFIAIIGDISILTYLLRIPKLMMGKKIDHPMIHYFHSPTVELKNVGNVPCYMEMDGELAFSCPVKFTCLPSMINFLDLR